jgi:hypothetical protein
LTACNSCCYRKPTSSGGNDEKLTYGDVETDSYARHLGSGILNNSKVLVSIYDFGGQQVFDCIHPLFLTRCGVYVVVFNMEWFQISLKKQECLEYLSFWVNSVTMYTRASNSSARLFLVGTHKDKVNDVDSHQGISAELYDLFSNSLAWYSLHYNWREELCFFPIDNRRGIEDPSIVYLMKSMEETIVSSPYVKQARPLSWFKTLDTVFEMKQSVLSLSNVYSLAVASQVLPSDIDAMLQFFNDMGMLMWHANDENLRNLVILDPVEYFVKPVTRVICEKLVHNRDLELSCRSQFAKNDCDNMLRGTLSDEILDFILGDRGRDAVMLKMLMQTYGMLVSWEPISISNPLPVKRKNLVPALFEKSSGNGFQATKSFLPCVFDESGMKIIYFVFSLDKRVLEGVVNEEDLIKSKCFLPHGLFTRLLCKALRRCNHVPDADLDRFILRENEAVIKFGNVSFGMRQVSRWNCIQVQVAAITAVSVVRALNEMIHQIIKESGQCLHVYPYIISSNALQLQLMPLDSAIWVAPKVDCRDSTAAATMFPAKGAPSSCAYDVFISYRWTDFNTLFTTDLVSRLEDYIIGDRVVNVFLDRESIEYGDNFRLAFFNALRASKVVVPIMSPGVLKELALRNVHEVDNMLLEWIAALVLQKYRQLHISAASKVSTIFPVALMDLNEDDVFALMDSGQIPDVKPTATQEAVVALFQLARIQLPTDLVAFIHDLTIRRVVADIMLTKVDRIKESRECILSRSAYRIVSVLHRLLLDGAAEVVVSLREYAIVDSVLQGKLSQFAHEFHENGITDDLLGYCNLDDAETLKRDLGTLHTSLTLFSIPVYVKIFLSKYKAALAATMDK